MFTLEELLKNLYRRERDRDEEGGKEEGGGGGRRGEREREKGGRGKEVESTINHGKHYTRKKEKETNI